MARTGGLAGIRVDGGTFMNFNITLLPGDGIGPEVVGEAVRVLDMIAVKFGHTFIFTERLMGGCAIDKYGSSLTDETLADRKSTRLNSSHLVISYAVFCLKKKKNNID